MGIGTSGEDNPQSLFERMQFSQILEDEHFGRVDIFKFKEPPFEYIMKYIKSYRQNDQQFKAQLQLIRRLTAKRHKNLTTIHHVQHKEGNIQVTQKSKQIYCNYYNFTLRDAIQKKKANGLHFPENQLWYVFWVLIDVGRFLKSEGLSFGNFRTRNIFLTPEGYIKLYLLHILPGNHHNGYFSVMARREQLDNYLLSPEQLQGIRRSEVGINWDVYKADIFTIGLVILELVFMDDSRFYYSSDQQNLEINFGRIKYNLGALKGQFSSQFQNLLFHCLEEDPALRYDFNEAGAYLDRLRARTNFAASIKLKDEDEQNKQKTKKKKEIGSSNISNMNMGVLGNLKVAPIQISSIEKNSDKRPRK